MLLAEYTKKNNQSVYDIKNPLDNQKPRRASDIPLNLLVNNITSVFESLYFISDKCHTRTWFFIFINLYLYFRNIFSWRSFST